MHFSLFRTGKGLALSIIISVTSICEQEVKNALLDLVTV